MIRLGLLIALLSLGACTFTSTSSPTPLGKVLLKLIVPACDPALAPCEAPK